MKIDIRKAAVSVAALALCGAGLGAAAMAQDDSQFVRNTDATTAACFRVDRVDGFAAVKFDHAYDGVNLRVRNDVYQMKFAAPCPSIREATQIKLNSRQPAYVCNGADAEIVTYSKIARPETCKVIGLRKIEAADVASLPANERP